MKAAAKLDFVEVAERILRGEASLETVPGVEPWPVRSDGSDSFLMLMHRELPGAVALFGVVGDEVVLCGAYSVRLYAACKEQRSEWFVFAECENKSGGAAVVCLIAAIAESAQRRMNEEFIFVAGVDACGVLRGLSKDWERANSEALH